MQNDMRREAAGVTTGVCPRQASTGDDAASVETLQQDVARWRLLLQLDSDDEVGWMGGDAGRLYFSIRDDDREVRRFERSWLFLQCG